MGGMLSLIQDPNLQPHPPPPPPAPPHPPQKMEMTFQKWIFLVNMYEFSRKYQWESLKTAELPTLLQN